MYSTKSIVVVLVAFCLAAVQAGAIARKSAESTDTVETTNNGIKVQSGYEGYLYTDDLSSGLVTRRAEARKDSSWFSPSQLDVFKALMMYKSSFLPMIGYKIVKIIFHLVFIVFFGMASTALVCTFSPICNISFKGSKPSFLTEKESLPQLKQAYEAISRIPNLLTSEKSPVQLQSEEPLAVSESTIGETLVDAIDPRNPDKNLDEKSPEENIDSRNSQKNLDEETQSLEPNHTEESKD